MVIRLHNLEQYEQFKEYAQEKAWSHSKSRGGIHVHDKYAEHNHTNDYFSVVVQDGIWYLSTEGGSKTDLDTLTGKYSCEYESLKYGN